MDSNLETYFFSIIMPAFNAEKYIEEAIRSVVQQSFTQWELIVVNDGSTDSTEQIVNNCRKLSTRIKLINQSNQKLGAARNAGVKAASGKWIAFLDADDLWLPQKLLHQFSIINNNPEADVVFTGGYTKYANEVIKIPYHLKTTYGLSDGHQMYQLQMFGNYVPVLSAVIKSGWFSKTGWFDENETAFGCEDHDYWLRLAKAGATFYGTTEKLFIYNIHNSNMSSDYHRQNYTSANIRIKNFDKTLLTENQVIQFKKSIKDVIRFLYKGNYSEWAKDLEVKLNGLPINTTYQISGLNINEYKKNFKFYVKRGVLLLLRSLVFPFKKWLSNYHKLVSAEYNKWLHSKNLTVKGYIKISPKAKLDFLNDKATICTYGMDIRDFSSLNLITEKSALITGADLIINKFCNFNILGRVVIGNNVLFNNYCTLNCFDEIVIGDNTWFGEGVKLYDHNHKYKQKDIPFTSQGYTTGKIKIGNNVWIGSNTVILQNVTIGDNCVIGANNLIYQSVPENIIIKSGLTEPISYGDYST